MRQKSKSDLGKRSLFLELDFVPVEPGIKIECELSHLNLIPLQVKIFCAVEISQHGAEVCDGVLQIAQAAKNAGINSMATSSQPAKVLAHRECSATNSHI